MAIYVRLDKIKATAHIESITSAGDLEQGVFVTLGALASDGESRTATPNENGVVLHVSSPLTYKDDETELDFVLKAGKVGRGYVLESGDIVSISADGVTGVVAANAKVGVNTGGLGFAVAESPTTKVTGEIIATEVDAIAGNLVVIRID